MAKLTDYVVPLLLLGISLFALGKGENGYDLLLSGAADGLKLLFSLVPALILMMCAVSMLRASGAIDLLSRWLSPVFVFFGIPPETAMLVLIRPISGSAALAVGADLMAQYGVDSQIGRTAAIMLGSTETTFYAISVYFGAAGIKKTRYTLPAALIADFTGFIEKNTAVGGSSGIQGHDIFGHNVVPPEYLCFHNYNIYTKQWQEKSPPFVRRAFESVVIFRQ